MPRADLNYIHARGNFSDLGFPLIEHDHDGARNQISVLARLGKFLSWRETGRFAHGHANFLEMLGEFSGRTILWQMAQSDANCHPRQIP